MDENALGYGFFDELSKLRGQEKRANIGVVAQGVKALAPRVLKGFGGGKALKFFGARAGIGAGVGAVGGAATSQEGRGLRGAARGAVLGGLAGAGVGAAQTGRALSRVGGAALKGRAIPQASYSGLRRAGFGSQGLREYRQAMRTGHWLK